MISEASKEGRNKRKRSRGVWMGRVLTGHLVFGCSSIYLSVHCISSRHIQASCLVTLKRVSKEAPTPDLFFCFRILN